MYKKTRVLNLKFEEKKLNVYFVRHAIIHGKINVNCVQ